jgi:hypothetical protein
MLLLLQAHVLSLTASVRTCRSSGCYTLALLRLLLLYTLILLLLHILLLLLLLSLPFHRLAQLLVVCRYVQGTALPAALHLLYT